MRLLVVFSVASIAFAGVGMIGCWDRGQEHIAWIGVAVMLNALLPLIREARSRPQAKLQEPM